MEVGGQDIIKFFVSNLPETCSLKEISDLFGAFGEVKGVYVAKKWDKMGNRFGFVSFLGARNRKDLADSLKNVWMGNYKLRIGIARFALENSVKSRPSKIGSRQNQGGGTSQINVGQPRFSRPSVLSATSLAYRDVLLGNSKNPRLEEKVVEVLSFVKPFGSWLGRRLIVRTRDLSTLVDMDKLLSCSGFKFKIKYVGGLFLLLTFDSFEELLAFKDSVSTLKDWFTWMEVWEGQVLPFERIA
ncbi:putative RNA recognition motif domain, nucleotide-binding alpha-beta plait domain superfamily [Helianthus annuus]|nr:putative RNA recognition motif domain, nucleotide-binding alpha-beta plait domain superfamily [Helianthus annuus]